MNMTSRKNLGYFLIRLFLLMYIEFHSIECTPTGQKPDASQNRFKRGYLKETTVNQEKTTADDHTNSSLNSRTSNDKTSIKSIEETTKAFAWSTSVSSEDISSNSGEETSTSTSQKREESFAWSGSDSSEDITSSSKEISPDEDKEPNFDSSTASPSTSKTKNKKSRHRKKKHKSKFAKKSSRHKSKKGRKSSRSRRRRSTTKRSFNKKLKPNIKVEIG